MTFWGPAGRPLLFALHVHAAFLFSYKKEAPARCRRARPQALELAFEFANVSKPPLHGSHGLRGGITGWTASSTSVMSVGPNQNSASTATRAFCAQHH